MADSASTAPADAEFRAHPTEDSPPRRLRFAAFAALSAAAATVLGVATAAPAGASLVWADDPCEDRGGQVALAPDFAVVVEDSAAAYVVCVDGTVIHHGTAGGQLSDELAALAPADFVDIAVTPDGGGAYVVTRSGAVETVGTATAYEPDTGWFDLLHRGDGADVVAIELTPNADGYWLASSDGRVAGFGAAPDLRLAPAPTAKAAPAVAFAPAGADGGWVATSAGRVLPVGTAPDLGSVTKLLAHGDAVVGLVPTPAGDGYWAVTSGGEILPGGGAAAEPDTATCRAQVHASPPFVGAVGDPRPEASAPLWTYTVHGGICGFAPGA